jgi:hypothetical protein
MVPALLKRLLPSHWTPSLAAARSLWFDYAHLASVRTGSCVDAQQKPVPWYTYPAIEYVKQLDFRGRSVFEFGSGNSTLFWASAAARVVSVEDDERWFRMMAPKVPRNCELILESDLDAYPAVITRSGEQYDVIVVDGAARGKTRLRCAEAALGHLRDGGMIILDNSDWLPESARLLREAGLIQVDMTGFVPINRHTQTTSFFLHRAFAFQPRGPRQPMPGPGAVEQVWEHPIPTEPPLVHCGRDVFGAVRRDERFTIPAPSGPREFRFIVAEPKEHGIRSAALLDVAQQRVLLSLTERMDRSSTIEARLEAAMRMTWAEFQRFVNGNDKRRYDLVG